MSSMPAILVEHDQADRALDILDAAVSRYPFYPELLKAQAEVQNGSSKMGRSRHYRQAVCCAQP